MGVSGQVLAAATNSTDGATVGLGGRNAVATKPVACQRQLLTQTAAIHSKSAANPAPKPRFVVHIVLPLGART